MVQRERDGGLPNISFDVKVVQPTDYLFRIGQSLSATDIVNDRRYPSRRISRTQFTNNPIFSGELTNMRARLSKGETTPRYSISSYLGLADGYKEREAHGYFDEAKVATIAQELTQIAPDKEVRVINLRRSSEIEIKKGEFMIMVEFGDRSHDTTLKSHQEYLDMRKETEPGGKHYEAFLKFQAELEAANPQTPEQKREEEEYQKVWKEMARNALGGYDPLSNDRNDTVSLHLRKEPASTDDPAELLDLLGGIPVATQEEFSKALEIFAECYIDVVNAICRAEGELPPSEKVFLGSAIISDR
jgi:hypothetical protein